MPNQRVSLDATFHALADPTRRRVLERLTRGPASVSELARPFRMALPSFLQHMKVLEKGALVHSEKTGRVRVYRLAPERIEAVEDWLGKQRRIWDQRLNRLDDYVMNLSEKESKND